MKTLKDKEQAILDIICNAYHKKYIGNLKVEDILNSKKEIIGYTLKLGLDKDDYPFILSKEGTFEEFLKFIDIEIRRSNLDTIDYFEGIQIYPNYEYR